MSPLLSTILLLVLAFTTNPGVAQTISSLSPSQLDDYNTLQFALTLENLEATFYTQALSTPALSNASFVAAGYPPSFYQYLEVIQSQEMQHVSLLTATINAIVPNSAAQPCTYHFTTAFASPAAFVATAAAFENTGQTAYDGAINAITNPAYAQVAASIVTVEARHAAYLNELVGVSPFPLTFDIANNASTVASIIAPYLTCSYNITAFFPTVRPSGVALVSGQVVHTGAQTTGTYTQAQQQNDIVALNYALTLENLEAAFYTYAVSTITEASFAAAGFPSYYYNYTLMIQAQEQTHALTLTTVINGRQAGAAVPPCTYNFTFTTPQQYAAIAQLLENTGVMAYDGAVNTITDTNLQQTAATIATVEGRHAAFIQQFNGVSPFPSVLDNATSPTVIIAAVLATGLIVSCPYTPVGPVVLSSTSVLGDPAFTGFNAQQFQVHGIPGRIFNILSLPSLQFNARFKMIEDGESMTAGQMKHARLLREIQGAGKDAKRQVSLPLTTAFSHAGTFLSEMGLKLGPLARVHVNAGSYLDGFSVVTINSKPLAVSSTPLSIEQGVYITFPSPHTLIVDTPTVSFSLVNSDGFFNIESATLNVAQTADLRIDGLLGQTADEKWTVKNTKEFKQHMVMDYLLANDDLFSDEFVANQFEAAKAD